MCSEPNCYGGNIEDEEGNPVGSCPACDAAPANLTIVDGFGNEVAAGLELSIARAAAQRAADRRNETVWLIAGKGDDGERFEPVVEEDAGDDYKADRKKLRDAFGSDLGGGADWANSAWSAGNGVFVWETDEACTYEIVRRTTVGDENTFVELAAGEVDVDLVIAKAKAFARDAS